MFVSFYDNNLSTSYNLFTAILLEHGQLVLGNFNCLRILSCYLLITGRLLQSAVQTTNELRASYSFSGKLIFN